MFFRLIVGLFHGAKQNTIDYFFLWLAAASLKEPLDLQRRDGFPFHGQAIAQTEKERCDGFQGLGIRPSWTR